MQATLALVMGSIFQQIVQADIGLFVWLNGQNAPWADPLMAAITHRYFWIPFYILLAIWLVWQVGVRKAGFQIVSIALVILLSDMVSSRLIKPVVARPRPCHQAALAPSIHTPVGCGGAFGFVSSHAANTFGLAFFLCFIYYKKQKHICWLFVWAAMVAYSRIYVGVHYPLDILGGLVLGLLVSVLVFWVGKKYVV